MTIALSYDRCLKAVFSRQFESLTCLHRKCQRDAAKRTEESHRSDRFIETAVYSGLQQCRVSCVVKKFNCGVNCPH